MEIAHVQIQNRLMRIEKLLSDGFSRLESRSPEKLRSAPAAGDKLLSQWSARIRADTEIRFPHRKILDLFLCEYDSASDRCPEIHFSKLVRAARIGKNKAKGYLDVLEAKGYIQTRTDGYRVFYTLKR